MQISAFSKSVKSILDDGYYVIPRFQRTYSWDDENVEEFWNDILQDFKNDYFIGSFILYKIDRDRMGVIDGQQRLTTLTILLCSIREAYKKNGNMDLFKGIQHYITKKNDKDEDVYILETQTSHPYFQDKVQAPNASDLDIECREEENRIRSCYNKLIDKVWEYAIVGGQDVRKVTKRLNALKTRVLDLKVICIDMDKESDAYIVFETMNTRGKNLSVVDLLKNFIFKTKPKQTRQLDVVKEKWNAMLKILYESDAKIDSGKFIYHYWLSVADYTPEVTLYREIAKATKPTMAESFLNELNDNAKYYRSVCEPSYWKWKQHEIEISESLGNTTRLLRIQMCLPVLLASFRSWQRKTMTQRQFSGIAEYLENFHFVHTTIGSMRSSGNLGRMYASYAKKIHACTDKNKTNAILTELKGKMHKMVIGRDEFIAKFKMLYYAKDSTAERQVVCYVLSKVHRFHMPGMPIDVSKCNIEHILPQSGKGKRIGEIGNLMLVDTGVNGDELKDKEVPEKVKILTKHGYKLDSIIVEHSLKWDDDAIEKRTQYLCELAYDKLWSL